MSVIRQDVRQLLVEHIHSVEQLEILLLLYRQKAREWSAEEVARELRIHPGSTAGRLQDLQARGFLSSRGEPTRRYLYQSVPGTDQAVDGLAVAYTEWRVKILELIFSKPIQNILVFADAFKLRDEDDG